MTPAVRAIVERLGLRPHPEGGWYSEVYRSDQEIVRRGERRRAATLIDFLLADGEVSRWHVVSSDEVWHFYEGSPIELVVSDPETEHLETALLGPFHEPGCVRHHVVKRRCWQMARPLGDFSLVGCTVAPGFEFSDFQFVDALPGHRRHFQSGAMAYLAAYL